MIYLPEIYEAKLESSVKNGNQLHKINVSKLISHVLSILLEKQNDTVVVQDFIGLSIYNSESRAVSKII